MPTVDMEGQVTIVVEEQVTVDEETPAERRSNARLLELDRVMSFRESLLTVPESESAFREPSGALTWV